MEEKKDNKGILIGIIVFLVICLITSGIFIFKIVNDKGENNKSSNNTNNEISNDESQNNNSTVFTELTKYELQEGEEKEVIVDNKKINIKNSNKKIYFNKKILDNENRTYINNSTYFYVTNKFIIFTRNGQTGEVYVFVDLNGNLINISEKNQEFAFNNLKLENNNLYVDGYDIRKIDLEYNTITIDNYYISSCDLGKNDNKKNISEYEPLIKEKENITLSGNYKIIYKDNEILFELVKSTETVKDFVENNSNLCVTEMSN